MSTKPKSYIVFFVEGDTDKVFFEALIRFYRDNSMSVINYCEVINLKGVSRYSNKIIGKLSNEVFPKIKERGIALKAVCCSYDTDVFSFSEKPPVDWKKVKKEVLKLGVERFCEIKVDQMIEDWFLDDTGGLCEFLKIKKPNNVEGKDGFDKIQSLFRKGSKLYLKANSVVQFMPFLNIETIRVKRLAALKEFETIINYKAVKK